MKFQKGARQSKHGSENGERQGWLNCRDPNVTFFQCDLLVAVNLQLEEGSLQVSNCNVLHSEQMQMEITL